MKEEIKKAILGRKKIKIICLYQDGVVAELEVLPFVPGKDFFGYEFLFGYINEFFHNCYKFRLDQLTNVELTEDSFSLPKGVVYFHAFGEEWEATDQEFREARTFCRGLDIEK